MTPPAASGRPRRRTRPPQHLLAKSIVFSFLLLAAFVIVAPFAYAAIASLQVAGRSGYSTANFSTLLQTIPVARDMGNSAILAVGAAVLTVLVCSLAGFAFAKLPFPGSQAMLFVCVGTLAVPVISIIVPEYVNVSNVSLIGSYPVTILLYSAFNMGLGVFFFASYFRSLPDSLIESALMDGAPHRRIFTRIMFPLALPAVVTVGVLIFIIVWNDLLVALLFMNGPNLRTISVGLATLASQHSANIGTVMAGSLISAIPTVIVYVFCQRYLVSGLTMGVER